MAAKKRFINRELSWIEFNYRVLEEALSDSTPLIERFVFLSIFSSNLDEFFMVRLSGVISQILSGITEKGPSGNSPEMVLNKAQKRIKELVKKQYQCLNKNLFPALKNEGYEFIKPDQLSEDEETALYKHFARHYKSIITPMAIDQSRPFPFIASKGLYILYKLEKTSHSLSVTKQNISQPFAIVPVPEGNRIIETNRKGRFIMLEDLISHFSHDLFKGYKILDRHCFRITRDADLSINEEDVADLLSALEDNLRQRERGALVRLEIPDQFPDEMKELLLSHLSNDNMQIISVPGYLDLTVFFSLPPLIKNPDLKFPERNPIIPSWMSRQESMFDLIKSQDRLLHVPFEGYDPVVKFLEEAADDAHVMGIKMTLYRTGGDSNIIRGLKRAARNGKQVSVLVELKARFDEAQNINWAKELEKAGCHVVYGFVGMKTHAKLLLIIREEEKGFKRYLHMSTGNYNEKTAKIYTDYSLFTCDPAFGKEVSEIFNFLTGYSEPLRWQNIITSPLDMRHFIIHKIRQEIAFTKQGKKGYILAKLNSLIDYTVIDELYEASRQGVKIDLIVRGLCRLIPGVKGMSDNISVRSIVGRYLEHTRACFFESGGDKNLYIASADWMERNFDRRVEVLFPVNDRYMKQEILTHLNYYLKDNVKARVMLRNGRYEIPALKDGEKPFAAQEMIYKHTEKKNTQRKKSGKEFKTIKRNNRHKDT